MRTIGKISVAAILTILLAGCNSKSPAQEELKEVSKRVVNGTTIALLTETGELHQGESTFTLQFQDAQGQPLEVSNVQISSSMSMPGMAPMQGGAHVSSTGSTGTFRVQSNFAMSGAWRFAISWHGPAGQGNTTFNQNVR